MAIEVGDKRGFSSAPYRRIQADLRARIRSGHWPAGATLPSRRQLALEYGVELSTLQRAMRGLLEDGTLRARGGSNTFVPEGAPQRKFLRPMPLGLLGLIYLRSQGDYCHSAIVRGVEHSFSRAGGAILHFDRTQMGGGCPVAVEQTIACALEKDCAAVIVITDDKSSLEVSVTKAAADSGRLLPGAALSPSPMSRSACSLTHDNEDAGYQAARHLIERGCTDLLYVPDFNRSYWGQQRQTGVRAAMSDAGLPARALRVAHTDLDFYVYKNLCLQSGRRAVRKDFAKAVPSGVVAANDQIAYGVMEEAEKIGLQAGTDYALIGFNDDDRLQSLSLSTMRPPFSEMGREAAEVAVRLLRGEAALARVTLRSHLVVRATSYRASTL